MTGQNKWEKELPMIEALLLRGKTYREIGDEIGVSKQRVYQIYRTHLRHLVNRAKGIVVKSAKNKRIEEVQKQLNQLERTKYSGRATHHHEDDTSRAKAAAFCRKKVNARRDKKWEWDLVPADVVFNDVCPYLGIPINWLGEFRDEDSPSFDRIDTNKGYIKGNVIVCSWRANRIKNNGTAEEHEKIAKALYAIR